MGIGTTTGTDTNGETKSGDKHFKRNGDRNWNWDMDYVNGQDRQWKRCPGAQSRWQKAGSNGLRDVWTLGTCAYWSGATSWAPVGEADARGWSGTPWLFCVKVFCKLLVHPWIPLLTQTKIPNGSSLFKAEWNIYAEFIADIGVVMEEKNCVGLVFLEKPKLRSGWRHSPLPGPAPLQHLKAVQSYKINDEVTPYTCRLKIIDCLPRTLEVEGHLGCFLKLLSFLRYPHGPPQLQSWLEMPLRRVCCRAHSHWWV